VTRPSPAIAADPAALGTPLLRRDASMTSASQNGLRTPANAARLPAERVAVLTNPRSHRNKRTGVSAPPPELAGLVEMPRSQGDLAVALARFAAAGIDLLVIDGGDGTVRDVITAAPAFFGESLPRIAIVPSGKTNALAIDLGLPADWTVRDAILAARAGRFASRAPIEIARADSTDLPVRGFLFGAGGFVRATSLAQRTHRAGAFKGFAVGLSLALAIGQTMFGSRSNSWRAGQRMVIGTQDGRRIDRDFYLLVGTTLERLPLGLRPFGRPRPGLKMLAVDAPPRAMALHVLPLLAGSEAAFLKRAGYHRADPDSFRLTLDGEFILDGEHYSGGELMVRTGAPIDFAVP